MCWLLYRYRNLKVETKTSVISFGYTKRVDQSSRAFKAQIQLPNNSFIEFQTSIIPTKVLILIGLDVLLEHNIDLDFEKHTINNKNDSREFPALYVKGRTYVLRHSPTARCSFSRKQFP